jgi:hypothetical protein
MRDPITLLLKLFGYEIRKPSLLLMSILNCTHESWLATMQRTDRLHGIEYKLYTEL